MVSEQTIERIRWHANFSKRNEPEDHSIAWSTVGTLGSGEKLYAAGLDMIDVLSVLNNELNGPVPSESAFDEDSTIQTVLVYFVAEILRILRESQSPECSFAETAERVEWMISTAWYAVLAGDIDDITEEFGSWEW